MPAPIRETTLEDLCEVVGYRATCILGVLFAGRQIYVPQRYYPQHPLAGLIGAHKLEALVAEYASHTFWIPHQDEIQRLRRDARVCELLVADTPLEEIAEALDMSKRRVEQLRADLIERGWVRWASAARPGRRQRRVLPVEGAGLGAFEPAGSGENSERAGSHAT